MYSKPMHKNQPNKRPQGVNLPITSSTESGAWLEGKGKPDTMQAEGVMNITGRVWESQDVCG